MRTTELGFFIISSNFILQEHKIYFQSNGLSIITLRQSGILEQFFRGKREPFTKRILKIQMLCLNAVIFSISRCYIINNYFILISKILALPCRSESIFSFILKRNNFLFCLVISSQKFKEKIKSGRIRIGGLTWTEHFLSDLK